MLIPSWAKFAAIALVAGASFTAGWKGAQNSRDSDELVAQKAAEKAGIAASDAAVAAIKNIDIKRVTIRQELEREIRVLPADDTDCSLPAGLLSAVNAALANPSTGADSLPRPDVAP